MVTRVNSLPVVATLCTLLCLTATATLAQSSSADFQRLLREKTTFEADDLAALEQGETIVKLAPVTDKREVAVSGLVNLRTNADHFLQSYLNGLGQKKNEAVIEAGRFGKAPVVADLQQLTIEPDDIEDLKQCVVGSCEVKLSAQMIERFRREVDWQANDYQARAALLLKTMLVDYVRDYLARGAPALIEYNDKRNGVRLADEQQALNTTSGYLNDLLRDQQSNMRLVEEAVVWSKFKFGLKPVLVIEHVKVYKDEREHGPQVLVASQQLYANHYFNSSLALTAFVSVPDADPAAYLVYENRSRTDGLQGAFGKLKRGMIENKTVAGLKLILEHTKLSLEGGPAAAAKAKAQSSGWGQRLFGGIRPFLWVSIISAILALLLLGKRRAAKPARTAQQRADI